MKELYPHEGIRSANSRLFKQYCAQVIGPVAYACFAVSYDRQTGDKVCMRDNCCIAVLKNCVGIGEASVRKQPFFVLLYGKLRAYSTFWGRNRGGELGCRSAALSASACSQCQCQHS